MATTQANGINIHYEDSGGDGPVVLFSHGFLMDHTMFDAQVAHLGRDDISGRMAEITCPTLVIHGTADNAIPIDRARFVADTVADCRGFVEVPGAAHAPNMSHPDIVNSALTEFLAGI